MRNDGTEEYFMALFNAFESRHDDHIKAYGSNNNLRLTGEYETQAIDKFSWGVSDRGASIRVPKDTAENWKGYVEDRRPGSNADPYKIIKEVSKSLETALQIDEMRGMMNKEVNIKGLSEKYGTITNEELLSEYMDDNYEYDKETMTSNMNVEPEVIKFDTESLIKSSLLPKELKNAMLNADKVETK